MSGILPFAELRGPDLIIDWGNLIQFPIIFKSEAEQVNYKKYVRSVLEKSPESKILIERDIYGLELFASNKKCIFGIYTFKPSGRDEKAIHSKFPTNYFNNTFIRKYLSELGTKIDEPLQVDIRSVNAALHELRGYNAGAVAVFDTLFGSKEDSWSENFNRQPDHIKSLYAFYRLTRFVLDNLNILDGEISLISNKEGFEQVSGHKSLNKIIKIINASRQKQVSLIGTSYANVRVSKQLFETLLFLIVTNAVKYTLSPAAEYPCVIIIDDSITLTITVKSVGKPIKDNEVVSIFSKGFRASNATTETRLEGSGMGLYNASRICDLFKGKIRYFNEPYRGGPGLVVNCFEITIPVSPSPRR
jgi:signal transduction histidine kinase